MNPAAAHGWCPSARREDVAKHPRRVIAVEQSGSPLDIPGDPRPAYLAMPECETDLMIHPAGRSDDHGRQ